MLFRLSAAAVVAIMPTSGSAQPETPAPGTITIVAATNASLPVETRRAFDNAVQRAMLKADFMPLPGQGHGRYVARVEVTRNSRGVVASGVHAALPPLVSLNGSVSLALPTRGGRMSDLVVTELKITIVRRSDERFIWSGRAVTARVSGTRAGAVDRVAQTLADAVMARFPNQAQEAISIP